MKIFRSLAWLILLMPLFPQSIFSQVDNTFSTQPKNIFDQYNFSLGFNAGINFNGSTNQASNMFPGSSIGIFSTVNLLKRQKINLQLGLQLFAEHWNTMFREKYNDDYMSTDFYFSYRNVNIGVVLSLFYHLKSRFYIYFCFGALMDLAIIKRAITVPAKQHLLIISQLTSWGVAMQLGGGILFPILPKKKYLLGAEFLFRPSITQDIRASFVGPDSHFMNIALFGKFIIILSKTH